MSTNSHEPWKDTDAVLTSHDPALIRHEHPPIDDDGTWVTHLQLRAENLPTVRVPARLLTPSAPDEEPICPTDLQTSVLLETTPLPVRDAAWRYLVAQARVHGGDWYLYAVGAAELGLRRIALRLTPSTAQPELIRRAHDDVVGEFLLALHRLRPGRAHVAKRLLDLTRYWTTVRYYSDGRHALIDTVTGDDTLDALAWPHPDGGVDDVLARLVYATRHSRAGARLTELDAELIARTRLERDHDDHRRTLAEVAAELGIPLPTARMRRWRAEKLVGRLLHAEREWR